MNMKEILDEEIENVKIKFYGYLEFVKDRIIERMAEESEEELKKFTQGFSYKSPSKGDMWNKWHEFSESTPCLENDVWVSDGRSIIYIQKWGEEDLVIYENQYVWQYCDTPELPEKKEIHHCSFNANMVYERNGKLYLVHHNYEDEINFCPICGFSLVDKE